MKIVFVLFLLCILGTGLYYFVEKESEIINYPPKEGPVIAFGDSLVKGVGARESENFVAVLSQKIGEPIMNMGVPGDTTTDGLVRLGEVLEEEPRIVIVLLGGNDRLRQLPFEETLENMRTIISKIQENGAIVLLLGVRGNIVTDRFEEAYESLAEETGSAYVPDVLDGIFGVDALMSDGIHPNAEGYRRIAEKIHPVLSPILR